MVLAGMVVRGLVTWSMEEIENVVLVRTANKNNQVIIRFLSDKAN